MALVDNFDSYNDGDLNGQGSWAGNVAFDVQASVVQAGAKAVSCASDSVSIYKNFVSQAAGAQVYYMRSTALERDTYVIFKEGTSNKVYTWLWSGDIGFNTSAGNFNVKTDAVINTWYKIRFEWRLNATVYEGRMSVDDGAFSDWKTLATTWTTGLDRISLETGEQAAGTSYWDSFSDPNAPPPAVGRSQGMII